MREMTWQESAQTFLRFFGERGHTVVPSSSLVPADDPTLLFTNAGMVQFKNVFLGLEGRPYDRAVTIQKCMRVSGHHNDLETVGPSPHHHTFFQMCGNFAFGSYFKREAIRYAWDLVTGGYGIELDRLFFTVLDSDDESFDAWRDVGVPVERIFRMGEATNFWMMGDVGPVGPNSELHYDWGREHCTCGRPDCSVALDNGCARWLEIWNLVFMQYEQAAGGVRTPLDRPGVDTGMGLERMVSVLQGRPSTYDTDLFTPIMERIQALFGHDARTRAASLVAYRVIADHARATAFLIADGIRPGNEGRAYVLRMIMRRAVRFGRQAGLDRPFLSRVCDQVVETMGGFYPELTAGHETINTLVLAEEERFSQTLAVGLARLDEVVAAAAEAGQTTLSGETVFRLYDTFGFPLEMTRDAARERGYAVDEEGFARAMAEQRDRARGASTMRLETVGPRVSITGQPRESERTEFVGYRTMSARASVTGILRDQANVDDAADGDEVVIILDRTPFYAESGGQVGDRGVLRSRRGEVAILDTQRSAQGIVVHLGRVRRGTVRVGDRFTATVDRPRRLDTMRNHTATHLLHRALHEIVGDHARQAGSLVAPDRLRFDFMHLTALTAEQRSAVEERVNEQILEGRRVRARVMPYDEAISQGAMALFGEKYGDRVRLVEVEGYSRELCGGTHVTETSQIGVFKIIGEGSAAAGIRRIEAVTGRGAYLYVRRQDEAAHELADLLRVPPAEIVARVRKLQSQVRELERALAATGSAGAAGDLDRLAGEVQDVEGVGVLALRLDGLTHDGLRRAADQLKRRLPSGVFVLGGEQQDKVNLIAMVTPDLVRRGLRADELLREVAVKVGGSGGGRADLAQAGGRELGRLDEALASVPSIVRRGLAPAVT